VLSLNVTGVTCADCASSIENNLIKFSAISSVRVSPLTHKAEVIYDKNSVSAIQIIQQIEKLGFGAEACSAPDALRLNVCLSGTWDSNTIQQHLKKQPGIVDVNFKSNIVLVDYNPEVVGPRTVLNLFTEFGHDATLASNTTEISQSEVKKWKRYLFVSVILCIPVLLVSFIFPLSSKLDSAFETELTTGLSVKVFIDWLFSTPIQIWVGRPLYISAYKALRYGHTANMDTLIVLSTTTAYLYSVISTIIAMSGSTFDGKILFYHSTNK
jgi:Cu+-exporting ATPase